MANTSCSSQRNNRTPSLGKALVFAGKRGHIKKHRPMRYTSGGVLLSQQALPTHGLTIFRCSFYRDKIAFR